MANQNREVTITAGIRDRLTAGLGKLRKALGATTDDTTKLARSGTKLGRVFRTLRAAAMKTAAAVTGVFRGALGLARKAIGAVFNLKTAVVALVAAIAVDRTIQEFRELIRTLNETTAASRRLGIAATELAALEFAGGKFGIEADRIRDALFELQNRVAEFRRTGGGPAVETLRDLNVQLLDSHGNIRSVSSLLPDVADGLADIDNQAQRIFAADQLFGGAGEDALILLQEGGDALRDVFAQVQRLAPALTNPEVFRQAERIASAFTSIKLAVTGLKAIVVETFGEDIERLLKAAADKLGDISTRVRLIAAGFRELFRDSDLGRELQASLGQLSGLIVATGSSLGKSLGVALVAGMAIGIRASGGLILDTMGFIGAEISAGFTTAIAKSMSLNLKWLASVADKLGASGFAASLRQSAADAAEGGAAVNAELDARFDFSEAIRDRVRKIVAATRSQFVGSDIVKNLTSDFADFREALGGVFDQLAGVGSQVAGRGAGGTESPPDQPKDGRFASLKRGFADVADSLRTVGGVGREVGRTIGQALTAGISDTLVDIIANARNAGEAFRAMAASVLSDMARIILRASLLKLFTSGPGGGAFGLFGFNAGGVVPGFNTGGLVPGRGPDRDSVPAMLTPGEYVIPRRLVDRIGVGILDRLTMGYSPAILAGFPGVQPIGQSIQRLNAGGVVRKTVPRPAAKAAPARAVIAWTDHDSEQLFKNSTSMMIRWMQQNRSAVRQAIGA